MARKKSWREKLNDSKDLPKVGRVIGKMTAKWGRGTMVIPAPLEVDEVIRKVPKGKLLTISEIRAYLARKHRATIGCRITTGIFAWIAAHAAEEAIGEGRNRVTPYWRTLKSGGELNPKISRRDREPEDPLGSGRPPGRAEGQTVPGRRLRRIPAAALIRLRRPSGLRRPGAMD